VLRMSRLFLHTLRHDPADAEAQSHRLLLRAGYIRQVAAGSHSWLPLGRIVLDNVVRVVRAEMEAIGGQEVVLPAPLPHEPYDHGKIINQLVKGECSSYRDLPLILYQIQTKYADEARPRSGLLWAREFLMQESYSFDLDDAGLATSYEAHREAYIKILDRLGLRYRVVSAGSGFEKFLALTEAGEYAFAACSMCDYAAALEAVRVSPPDVDATVEHPLMEELHTPDTPTIDTLCALLGVQASATLKNLLVRTASGEIVAVGVPGDREVDLDRLWAALGPVEIFDDFDARPDLAKGYIGPQALPPDVRYIADPRVAPGTVWVTGAGKPDRHARNVVCGRDFAVGDYADVATLLSGDPCPRCAAELTLERAIEVATVSQVGRSYSDAFEVDVSGPDGRPVRLTMGAYGAGLSRLVAAVAEQTHDDRGLCWPRELAPADVHVVATGKDDQVTVALKVSGELEAHGLRVLVDDRAGVSPGVKFTDAELIGVPTILVVGRGLADGVVELRDRAGGSRTEIPVGDIVGHLVFPP
jgi:prolyl-tRNA synthetase